VVTAHSSFPQNAEARALWLSRYAAFADAAGVDAEMTEQARSAVAALQHIQTPADDEALLERAGFTGIELFYAAFTWKAWVAYA
jgi:tRNA (cmo5U34)-methyltransferase